METDQSRTAVECLHSPQSCGARTCVQRSHSCERAFGLTRLVTNAPPQSLGACQQGSAHQLEGRKKHQRQETKKSDAVSRNPAAKLPRSCETRAGDLVLISLAPSQFLVTALNDDLNYRKQSSQSARPTPRILAAMIGLS
jgi:hypothetical protein